MKYNQQARGPPSGLCLSTCSLVVNHYSFIYAQAQFFKLRKGQLTRSSTIENKIQRLGVDQIAFNCFTIGCLDLRNTRNPHMHLISGNLDKSSTVTGVPHRIHS